MTDTFGVALATDIHSTFTAITSVGGAVAVAGPDQDVNRGETVVLDGTGSFDPNERQLSYRWRQIGSAPPAIEGSSSARVVAQRFMFTAG